MSQDSYMFLFTEFIIRPGETEREIAGLAPGCRFRPHSVTLDFGTEGDMGQLWHILKVGWLSVWCQDRALLCRQPVREVPAGHGLACYRTPDPEEKPWSMAISPETPVTVRLSLGSPLPRRADLTDAPVRCRVTLHGRRERSGGWADMT